MSDFEPVTPPAFVLAAVLIAPSGGTGRAQPASPKLGWWTAETAT